MKTLKKKKLGMFNSFMTISNFIQLLFLTALEHFLSKRVCGYEESPDLKTQF